MFITSTEWRPIDGELISVDLNFDGVAAGIFAGASVRTIATEYGTRFEVPNARLVRWVDPGRLAVLSDNTLGIYGIDGAPDEMPPGLHALRSGGFTRPTPDGYQQILPSQQRR